MSRFFDPPQAKPLLPKEKIDKVFKSMKTLNLMDLNTLSMQPII